MLAAPAVAPPTIARTDQPRGGAALIARIGLVNFSLYAALLTPVIVTLALRVGQLDPAHKARSLGLVTATGALVALLANPVTGRLSDRTRSRFGRRRPWLIGGALGGAVGLATIATAPAIPVVAAGWCLTQLSYNACLSALQATIPEQIPARLRGRMSGVMGLSRTAGIISGTGLAALFSFSVPAQFLAGPVLVVLAVTVLAARLADRSPASRPARLSLREIAGTFWINPRRHPDLGWYWLTRFCAVFGGVLPLAYLAYYLPDRLGVAAGRIPQTVFLFTATSAGVTVIVAAFAGWLSDRLGRRRAFVLAGCSVNAAALVVFASTHRAGVALAAEVMLGLGNGLYHSVDLAVISHVLPDPETVGKDMGVFNIANTLPQTIGPAIAPALLALQGYGLLFGFGAVSVATAAVLVTRVRAVA